MVDIKEEILDFLSHRPDVVGAFGYGSGIFRQIGYKENEKPQIDLIIIVEDMKKWHQENIKSNKCDYSLSGNLCFTKLPNNIAKATTGISYQSNIKYKNKIFKYGIIEKRDFLNFMQSWKSFYVPGRFQKPIFPIITNDTLDRVIEENRENAIKVGLLTLQKENPNIKDLYYNITALSYMGDIRMVFAENPNKIRNIVEGSLDEFNKIYKQNHKYFETDSKGKINFDMCNLTSKDTLSSLPTTLYKEIIKNDYYTKKDLIEIRKVILSYIEKINKKESIIQPAKGILTNGISKSLVYVIPKIEKKFKK